MKPAKWIFAVLAVIFGCLVLQYRTVRQNAGPGEVEVNKRAQAQASNEIHPQPPQIKAALAENTSKSNPVEPPPGEAGVLNAASELKGASNTNAIQQFVDWTERYLAAPESERAKMVNEGTILGAARAAEMKLLIQADPEGAINAALAVPTLQQLPEAVKNVIERRFGGQVYYMVAARPLTAEADPETPAIVRYVFAGDKQWKAYVYGNRERQITGSDVPLHGVYVDDVMAVHENPVRLLERGEKPDRRKGEFRKDLVCGISSQSASPDVAVELGGQNVYLCDPAHAADLAERISGEWFHGTAGSGAVGSSGGGGGSPYRPPQSWTTGWKRVLYMRLRFADDPPGYEPWSAETAWNEAYAATEYYHRASYGAVTPYPTITETLSLPLNRNQYSWTQAVEAGKLAFDEQQQGSDFSSLYDFFVAACQLSNPGAAGWAEVGGSRAWVGLPDAGIVAHELGHNFGMWHANRWDADKVVIGPGTHVEYGDRFDVMGSAWIPGNMNPAHRYWLWWLEPSRIHDNITGNPPGTVYRVFSFDEAEPVPEFPEMRFALKLPTSDGRSYWFSYRTGTPGEFQAASQRALMAHWFPAKQGSGTQLLDTAPKSWVYDDFDPSIRMGQTFHDPEAQFRITPINTGIEWEAKWIDVVVFTGDYPANNAPVISSINGSSSVGVGVSSLFTVTTSDPDGDVLYCNWDFGDSTTAPAGAGWVYSWSRPGVHRYTCTVTDGKGGIASKTGTITVGTPPLSDSITQGRVTMAGSGMPVAGVRIFTRHKERYGISDSDGYYKIAAIDTTMQGSITLSATGPLLTVTYSTATPTINIGSGQSLTVDFQGSL